MKHSNSHLQNVAKCHRMATDARNNQRQAHERAVMGTAMHDAFSGHHKTGAPLLDCLDVSLAKPVFGNDFYGADTNILSAEQGAEIREWCANWRHPLPEGAEIVEVEVRKTFEYLGITFSVQLDVLYRDADGTLTVRDYKSGYSAYDTASSAQGMLYGMAAALEHFEESIRFEHALVTQNKLQPVTWTLEQMEAGVKELVLLARRVEADPDSQRETAGGHCQHCPLRSDCATYEASLKVGGMPPIQDETAFSAYTKHLKGVAKVFDRDTKAATKALKQHIATLPGNQYAGFRIDRGSRSYYDLERVMLELGAPPAFAAQFRGMQQSSLGNLGKVAEANGIDLKGTAKRVYFDKLMELK